MPPPYSVDDDTSRYAAFSPRPPRPIGLSALPSRQVGIPTAPLNAPSPHATHAMIPDPNTQPKPQPTIGPTPSFMPGSSPMPRPQGYGPEQVGVAPSPVMPASVGIAPPAATAPPKPTGTPNMLAEPAGEGGLPEWSRALMEQRGLDPANFTMQSGAIVDRRGPTPGTTSTPDELAFYDHARGMFPANEPGLEGFDRTRAQIGVQGQPPAQVGVQSTPMSAWSSYPWSHQQRRNDALQRIAEDFQRASQSGDRQAMVELSGERAALDRGGFEAQAEYAREAAKAKAERDSFAIRSRSEASNQDLSRAQAESLRGKLTNDQSVWSDPTKAWVATFNQTGGDRAAADAVEQRIRSGMPGGRGGPQDPNQAASILQRNPSISALFPGGDTKPKDLPEIYSKLKAIAPPGWDDPNSELGRSIATSLRGGYGEDLESQLRPPLVDPSQVGGIMPFMDTQRYGNLARALQWIPPARIMNQAIFGDVDPFHSYRRRQDASDWYKRISANPNQPQ